MKLIILFMALLPAMSWATVIIRPSVNEGFFVCNAGIAHKISTGTSCVNIITGLTCSNSDESSCLCSNSEAGADSLAVSWEDLNISDSSSLRFRSNILTANSTGQFATLFSNDAAWNNKINDVQINSSSETYGTSYFIDFCYQGPIENLIKKNGSLKDSSEGVYTLTAEINAQDLSSGSTYAEDANLAMNLVVNCDLRNAGKYRDTRLSTQFSPTDNTLENDMDFEIIGYPRANTLSLSQRINSQNKLVPRFCMIRATFTEMTNTSAVKPRPNSEIPNEFTIDLDITNGSAL